jgi:hypothetical protein
MESTRWYVKVRNESVGPLTIDELEELIRIGSIGPQTPVSTNQADWNAGENVPCLTLSSTRSPETSVAPTHEVPVRASARNLIAAATAAVVVLFVIGWASTPHETQSRPSTSGSPSQQVLQAADRTYQYWRQVSGIFKAAAAAPNGVATFRSSAAAVDELPTAGVDPDAVNCALGFAALLKECADVVQSDNDPAGTADQMLRAFYGGWSGDFQPLVRDLESRNDAHKALSGHVKSVEQQLVQTRAILGSRYGVEFPSL